MFELDQTHDGTARSRVTSANDSSGDFPIQNLPFGVFRRCGTDEPLRGGVAIGDQILDLGALSQTGCLTDVAGQALSASAGSTLNPLLAMGWPAWRSLRHGLFDLLKEAEPSPRRPEVMRCLVPQAAALHSLPLQIGDYSDFYTSLYHAVNIGRMFGITTEGSNFEWLPIAYHGRVSSIAVSGQAFHRPSGQTKRPNENAPALRRGLRSRATRNTGRPTPVLAAGDPDGTHTARRLPPWLSAGRGVDWLDYRVAWSDAARARSYNAQPSLCDAGRAAAATQRRGPWREGAAFALAGGQHRVEAVRCG